MTREREYNFSADGFLYQLMCCATAMIGWHKHHSVLFAICDWIFMPFVWIKWLVLQEVNVTIIRETFGFFFK
jgi:hypothetical protein